MLHDVEASGLIGQYKTQRGEEIVKIETQHA